MPIIDDYELDVKIEPEVTPIAVPVSDLGDFPLKRDLYKSKMVNSTYVSEKALLINIEGERWVVDYYRQLLGKDEESAALRVGSSDILQQYQLIKDFVLKVNDPLTSTHNSEIDTFETTGAATIYPSIIPNVSDMFITDIGDGRLGRFAITGYEKLSILKDTCYRIDYQLVGYVDVETIKDLDDKVVETSYFDLDGYTLNRTPLLTSSEVELKRTMNDTYGSLVQRYYDEFYSNRFKTIILPVEDYVVYDPYVTEFMLSIITRDERMDLPRLAMLDTNVNFDKPIRTIWELILSGDMLSFDLIRKDMRMVNSGDLSMYPTYGNIKYLGVHGVIYPTDVPTPREGTRFIRSVPVNTTVGPGTPLEDVIGYMGYRPSLSGSYVFSDAFYSGDYEGMYPIERLARHLMAQRSINAPTVIAILKSVPKMTPMQRFYHIPVLLLLIKSIVADGCVDATDLSSKLLVPPAMKIGVLPHRHSISDVDLLRGELNDLA